MSDTLFDEPTSSPDDDIEQVAPVDVPALRTRRTWPALVAFVAPVVIAVVAIVALWGIGGNSPTTAPVPVGTTYTYVIPDGTALKMQNNQFVADILPEFVTLVVGDSIVVENQDSSTHTFGPITVRAKETTSVDFINPGLYYGLCTVGTHDSITIQVNPAV